VLKPIIPSRTRSYRPDRRPQDAGAGSRSRDAALGTTWKKLPAAEAPAVGFRERASMGPAPRISVVVPIYNEEESLPVLYREVRETLDGRGWSWELIFVDDRSSDGSLGAALALRAEDPRVKLVCFRRNFGQTAALSAGFEMSRGEIVVTMDGDLQNDPADIPELVARIDEGWDIAAGWRKDRRDAYLLRRVPSWLANRLVAAVTGTRVHDTGCTLKAFRRQVVKNLPIYAEQHRFLPAMSRSSGARVSEVVVHHRPRRFGRSKYGLGRAVRVLLDLLAIQMISRFSHRPLHYFGLFSLPFAGASLFFLFMGTVNWHTFELVDEWPQFVVFVFVLFLLLAVYFVLLGLLSELAVTASGMHRRPVLDRILSEPH
jgi:glycosyltransferase involved in cell wall biosynthesis